MYQVINVTHSEKVEMYQMIKKDSLIEMLIEANNNIERLTNKNLNLYYPLSPNDVFLEESENSAHNILSNVLHFLKTSQDEYFTYLDRNNEVQSTKNLIDGVEKLVKQIQK
jgi:hypothetical protein